MEISTFHKNQLKDLDAKVAQVDKALSRLIPRHRELTDEQRALRLQCGLCIICGKRPAFELDRCHECFEMTRAKYEVDDDPAEVEAPSD